MEHGRTPVSLRAVNLNLIPVLRALLRERNLSGAARALHLTQPAVSAALARLRVVLKDPLLVQVGRNMELTLRALELVGPVERACAALDQVLAAPVFEPLVARRTFVVSVADYSPVVLAPPMVRALSEQAPGVSIHFVNGSLHALAKRRLTDVDLMFAPRTVVDGLFPGALHTQHLLRDQFVYTLGPGHPLYDVAQPTAAQLAAQPLMRFQLADMSESVGGAMPGLRELGAPPAGEHGRTGPDVILVEQFNVLPLLALLTGSMALVPRRLTEPLQSYVPLRIIDAGLAPIDLCIAWSPLHDADPAHRWFRELLRDTVGDHRFGAADG